MAQGFDFQGAGETHLLERYLAELHSKAIQIQVLWRRLHARPGDRDALANLSLHVHRLAGSAGPYGLPALSEAARFVDQIITPLARGEGALPEAMLTTLQPLMERLQQRLVEPA